MAENTRNYDLIVIGAGPGGYVAALRAAQRGMRTALVERESVGGICLNWGCIPTKALLRSAHLYQEMREARTFGLQAEAVGFDYPAVVRRSRQVVDRLVKGVQFLLRRAQVDVVQGHGRLVGREGRFVVRVESGASGEGPATLLAPQVILATGARARELQGIPYDGVRVISSREALALTEVPRRILVIGAGAIGAEFADIFAAFGAEVTVVEMLPRALPGIDEEAAAELQRAFAKRRIRILTGSVVEGVEIAGDLVRCRVAPFGEGRLGASSAATTIEVDRVLVGVGLTGNVHELGIESVGLASSKGFLEVDRDLQTAVPGLYAIGDLAGPPLLAHVASAEGIHAVDHAAGLTPPAIDYDWVPSVVYTSPPIACVGLDEVAARTRHGEAFDVGRFPIRASGRAIAEGETGGFVKVILEKGSRRLLGAQVVGLSADELIAELGVIGRCGIKAPDLLQVIHAHPTLSEAIPEAIGAALGEALHS